MHVPADLYWHSALVQKTRPVWRALCGLESRLLAEELAAITIEAPVYVAGVARSGSTILLEMLNSHPHLTSHRYSDFPYVYTPYWRNWLKRKAGTLTSTEVERAHRDRIKVSEHSPEAIEEVLWMEFFPDLHRADNNQLMTATLSNPAFERFYRDHIAKLLLVRQRRRYLAKGNYNLTRIAYLHRLFPDARFVIPVRHPVNHIASLMKQDALFTAGVAANPRAGDYLQWAGHYEFGPHKTAVNTGDSAEAHAIEACWRKGDALEGWARLWSSQYRATLDLLGQYPQLAKQCMLVRYEDLCNDSENMIDSLLGHCQLPAEAFSEQRLHYTGKLEQPDYYQPEFSAAEQRVIERSCTEVAARLGY